MRPLKIGILLNPANGIKDYEARIFSTLFEDPRYEVICTLKDGRNTTPPEGNFLKTLLLGIVGLVEKPLVNKKAQKCVDMADVSARVSALPCIGMTPVKEGARDVFSKEDCATLEKLNLDVLLKHEFGIIEGEILNVPKYGIWSLHHSESDVGRKEPSGFWEVYNKSSVTSVTLQVLVNDFDVGGVIQKGFYNTHDFWYFNNERILDNSVDLLLKHLGLLYVNRELETNPGAVYENKPYTPPTTSQLIDYILKKYPVFTARKIWRLLTTRVKVDPAKNVWKLHLGKGCIEDAPLSALKTIEPPGNEFWADPFLIEYRKQVFIFFENYEYSKGKGKVSAGKIKEGRITDVIDTLDVDYHLSYPFVFNHNNEIYMIPETGAMKRLEIWKCNAFPNHWSLEKTCFEGVSLRDSTIAKDSNNQYWLFTNIAYGKILDHDSHLYVFKIDSPLMNEIVPHKLNPVITDSRSARNGGNIYIDKNGRMIRPSQANQNGIYGECLNLCHVKDLTLDTYEEEVLETIAPKFKYGLRSTHHLSQAGGLFVIDGCYLNR